jgi:trans-2,3-dihydro-3-hydroxyanthranilate isomerase
MKQLMSSSLPFRHVDVFSERPYAGNGLIVVFGGVNEPAACLLLVAQELRQFETIFVEVLGGGGGVRARIFTVEEELPFAGHPIIGAAAALHERLWPDQAERRWLFEIAGRSIAVSSARSGDYYAATMNQGRPEILQAVGDDERSAFAEALGIHERDLLPLPLQVISTGLPYLIVPVTPQGLERAHVVDDLGDQLASIGARFVYVLDPSAPEGRTWDNAGAVEDVATGSAAGPVVAYLDAHLEQAPRAEVRLHQGRFVGRPSVLTIKRGPDGGLMVGGAVAPVAAGEIDLPSPGMAGYVKC